MRRSASERRAALEEKKKQIEAELAALSARERAAVRKKDTRRKIIIGAAVLAHAELDSAFAIRLREVVNLAVQRPVDREVIADLLSPSADRPLSSPGATRLGSAADNG